MKKKITVIGGSGFVGTNLCRQLTLKNWDFEIIDLKKSCQFPDKFKFGDVRDAESLLKPITGDIVVNLAAIHRDDVRDNSEYWQTNVHGAENITEVCRSKNIDKIIFTSSVAVYGFAEPGTDERGKINPFNDYGLSKFQAEEIFRSWKFETDASLIIVRPTVVFGEGNRGNVFNLFNQIASGKFLMIGSGRNKKSLAYISNLVSFLEACISTEKNDGLYNYVDTPDLTMNELVALVRNKLKNKQGPGLRFPYWFGLFIGYCADFVGKVTFKTFPVSAIRVKKFVASTEFVSCKIELDGFEPPFQLVEGVNRTLESEFISPEPNREVFYTE